MPISTLVCVLQSALQAGPIVPIVDRCIGLLPCTYWLENFLRAPVYIKGSKKISIPDPSQWKDVEAQTTKPIFFAANANKPSFKQQLLRAMGFDDIGLLVVL